MDRAAFDGGHKKTFWEELNVEPPPPGDSPHILLPPNDELLRAFRDRNATEVQRITVAHNLAHSETWRNRLHELLAEPRGKGNNEEEL